MLLCLTQSQVSDHLVNVTSCSDVLRGKFVRRLLGFFKPASDGEFVQLPWDADFAPYTLVAANLISILLQVSVFSMKMVNR